MICPHCNYNERPITQEGTRTIYHDGEYGSMYKLAIKLERESGMFYGRDSKVLAGCPVCLKIFIED